MVLTSVPSLKVRILRRCLHQQRLRMPTFKDVAKVNTVFESCSLSKTVFWDLSLIFLSFDDVTFNDVHPLFDRRRISFF